MAEIGDGGAVPGEGSEASRVQGVFVPGWHNVIPSSFNDLVAGIAGVGLLVMLCWLSLQGVEAARVTLTAGFTLWLGWAIRGRVEAAKNEERPPRHVT